DAVVLREPTGRVGVVPNAAYRHFANRLALLQAVRMAALAHLARAIEGKLGAVSAGLGAAEEARASLRAVGLGYLEFAFTETGLYRTIFWGPAEWPLTPIRPGPAPRASLRSSFSAPRSTASSRPQRSRPSADGARSFSPGRPCMASPCW